MICSSHTFSYHSRRGMRSSFSAAFNRALEKDCEVRYQSASEMRADLKSITASLPGETSRGGVKPALHRRWGVVTAGVFVLLLVATIAWFTTRQPSTRPELKQRQLTANSSENAVTGGAISPDGKYLAYTDTKGIHIKLIETGAEKCHCLDRIRFGLGAMHISKGLGSP